MEEIVTAFVGAVVVAAACLLIRLFFGCFVLFILFFYTKFLVIIVENRLFDTNCENTVVSAAILYPDVIKKV